jgi:hypothetical protein
MSSALIGSSDEGISPSCPAIRAISALTRPLDDLGQVAVEPFGEHRPEQVAGQPFERGLARADDLRRRARLGDHRQRGERFAHRLRGAGSGQAVLAALDAARFAELEHFFGLVSSALPSWSVGLARRQHHAGVSRRRRSA